MSKDLSLRPAIIQIERLDGMWNNSHSKIPNVFIDHEADLRMGEGNDKAIDINKAAIFAGLGETRKAFILMMFEAKVVDFVIAAPKVENYCNPFANSYNSKMGELTDLPMN